MSKFDLPVHELTLDAESPSWAGYCPWTGTPCIGSEEGGFWLASADAKAAPMRTRRSLSGAVNGVAFIHRHQALTSPSEIALYGRGHIDRQPGSPLTAASVPRGAHDVAASVAEAMFVMTLGQDGLMAARYFQGSYATWAYNLPDEYFYKIAYAGTGREGETFVVACRRSGFLVLSVDPDSMKIRGLKPRSDVGDIVATAGVGNGVGFLTLSLDGVVQYYPHTSAGFSIALKPRTPLYAYTMVRCGPHLLIHHRAGLSCIPFFVARCLGKPSPGGPPVNFDMVTDCWDVLPYNNEAFVMMESEGAYVIRMADVLQTTAGKATAAAERAMPRQRPSAFGEAVSRPGGGLVRLGRKPTRREDRAVPLAAV